MEHVDYPHWPGTLFDCEGCEYGECVCDSDAIGCASMACRFDSVPVEIVFSEEE